MKYISSFVGDTKSKISSIEDSRILYWKNYFYFFHNKIKKNKSIFSFISIDQENNIIKNEEVCKNIRKPFEKNWGGFFIDNELFFLYSLVPLKIIKMEKKCKIMESKNYPFFYKILKYYGKKINMYIRNSTPLVQIEDSKDHIKFLGIGHSVLKFNENDKEILLKWFFKNQQRQLFSLSDFDKKYFSTSYPQIYYHFFYILLYNKTSKDFEIEKISPMFHFETEYEHTLEFVNDITLYKKYLYIGMGIEDIRPILKRIQLDTILRFLKTEEEFESVENYPIQNSFINYFNVYTSKKILIETIDLNKELSKHLHKNFTYFNVGISHIKDNNFIISFRSYKGNIRSWDGISTIIYFKVEITDDFQFQNIKELNQITFKNKNYEIKEFSV